MSYLYLLITIFGSLEEILKHVHKVVLNEHKYSKKKHLMTITCSTYVAIAKEPTLKVTRTKYLPVDILCEVSLLQTKQDIDQAC